MEKLIRDNLQNGEKILWTGKPENFKLLDHHFVFSVISRWVVAALFVVLCIWNTIISIRAGADSSTRNILYLVAALVLYLAIEPLLVLQRLKTTCLYCVTNQRALIAIVRGKNSKLRFRMLDEVNEVSVETIANNQGLISIGKPVSGSVSYCRDISTHLTMPDHDVPLMFYSVSAPQEVKAIIERAAGIAATPGQSLPTAS